MSEPYTNPSKAIIFLINIFQPLIRPSYKKYLKTLNLQENNKVLELGPGPGIMSKLISKYISGEDSLLTCVDISETWIRVLKRKMRKQGK